jgi:hypothetical protein
MQKQTQIIRPIIEKVMELYRSLVCETQPPAVALLEGHLGGSIIQHEVSPEPYDTFQLADLILPRPNVQLGLHMQKMTSPPYVATRQTTTL